MSKYPMPAVGPLIVAVTVLEALHDPREKRSLHSHQENYLVPPTLIVAAVTTTVDRATNWGNSSTKLFWR